MKEKRDQNEGKNRMEFRNIESPNENIVHRPKGKFRRHTHMREAERAQELCWFVASNRLLLNCSVYKSIC